MSALSSYLEGLKADAERASVAEEAFRREIAARTRALEQERAFAFRRLNLMRAVADAIAAAENEEMAVASAVAVLRGRLGWSGDSDARTEVLSRFKAVAQAMSTQLAPEESEREPVDVGQSLADFEHWYAATHPKPFWVLFENVMPETPLVDF